LSSVAATLLFSLALMGPLSFGGLALATSLAFSLSGWVGVRILSRHLGMRFGIFSVPWTAKMGVSLAFTGLIVVAWRWFFPYSPESSGILRAAWVGGVFCAAASGYAAVTALLRFQEWRWLFGALRRKDRRETPGQNAKEE
ncbi:MAG: murein biosynthesis integral membrane protein MurJ, partial [Synergistaceae bacterium]|nr:murein biosynthesis integral membrane protein MurJ [Synergistaceae bacterium]